MLATAGGVRFSMSTYHSCLSNVLGYAARISVSIEVPGALGTVSEK